MNETAKDDYLWDRSGEPDDTLRHLESALFEYRYAGSWRRNDDMEQSDDLPPAESEA